MYSRTTNFKVKLYVFEKLVYELHIHLFDIIQIHKFQKTHIYRFNPLERGKRSPQVVRREQISSLEWESLYRF